MLEAVAVGIGLTVKPVEVLVVPHSLVTATDTVFGPLFENVTDPGEAEVELDGDPVVKVQEYVGGFEAQLVTLAIGLTVAVPQLLGMLCRVTSGGFLTVMVLVAVTVPQILLVLKVTE